MFFHWGKLVNMGHQTKQTTVETAYYSPTRRLHWFDLGLIATEDMVIAILGIIKKAVMLGTFYEHRPSNS